MNQNPSTLSPARAAKMLRGLGKSIAKLTIRRITLKVEVILDR